MKMKRRTDIRRKTGGKGKHGSYQLVSSVTGPPKGRHPKPKKPRSQKPEEPKSPLLTSLFEVSNQSLSQITDFLIKNIKEIAQSELSVEALTSLLSMIAKACENDIVQIKSNMLRSVINERLIIKLRIFLTGMATIDEPSKEPVLNVLTILEDGLFLIPNTCKELVEMVVKNLGLIVPVLKGDWSSELERVAKLQKDLVSLEGLFKKLSLDGVVVDDVGTEAPPDDIRQDFNINQFKCCELTNPERGFIRKNVIKGPYSCVEDYIDIHFRLLREDFLGPIREDVCDFLNHRQRHMFNIKIHKNVTVLERISEKDKLLTRVQIYVSDKFTKLIASGQHKRFMHGALLIFSSDDFKTLFTGKVAENKDLAKGRLDVDLQGDNGKDINNGTFTMVECSIFYEPYFQVLRALQKIETIPLERYIINVETNISVPQYMQNLPPFKLPNFLNPSQSEAMRAALNKELVIIQGPPGTGKTFLGMELVKFLLKIKQDINLHGPILIVTYTNHALEQFLAGLRDSTKKIVRLGHGSQDLRKVEQETGRVANDLYRCLKENEEEINPIKSLLKGLDSKELLHLELIGIGDPIAELCWLMCNDGTVFPKKKYPKDDGYEYLLNLLYLFHYELRAIRARHVLKIHSLRNIRKFVDEEMSQELSKELKLISSKADFLQNCLNTDFGETTDQLDNYRDIFEMPCKTRWQIYQRRCKLKKESLRAQLDVKEQFQRVRWENYFKTREMDDDILLTRMDIVAMTTTRAAKMRSTLETIQCPIVLVEEAAEVLESHIIAALTTSCQHLILLGDHQQLRPKTADNTVGQKYNLGISLFERMVKNNVECHTLNVQHRMRPEISSLICPLFYKELSNHPHVNEYPLISGIKYPLYFIDHLEPEEPYGDSSKMNVHEAKFLIQLAIFLLNNNYEPEDITILAAYRGQMYEMKRQQLLCKNEKLQKVVIAVVDNFQGEENKIILLSLVRNNMEGSVGFLSIDNRVCVALSRAKHGLYIMGNMDILSNSAEMWKSIRSTLETQHAIGRYLPLVCNIHSHHETLVSTVTDFEKVPNGGCNQMCNTNLECGHTCNMICHAFDRDHKHYECKAKCNRLPCGNPEHPCPRRCFQECGPCEHRVERTFSCGHTAMLECYIDVTEELCMVPKPVKPGCGHESTIPCHQREATYSCQKLVQRVFTCGHSNEMPCGQELEEFKCQQQVEVKLKKCGHIASKECHINSSQMTCSEIVEKQLSCKHKVQVKCGQHVGTKKCSVKKVVTFTCGHDNPIECSGFERVMRPGRLFDRNFPKCEKMCGKELACGHICHKKCFEECEPCVLHTSRK